MKDWLDRFLGSPRNRAASGFPAPWPANSTSIYRFLLAQRRSEAPSPSGSDPVALPDEERLLARQGNGLRWVAGGADGAFGHHGRPEKSNDAAKIAKVLTAALRSRSARDIAAFYNFICEDNAITIVDPLLDEVSKSTRISAESLREFARWLAMESPDRGAVKVALALLGAVTPARDTSLLVTLGSHEEFTLFAVVALGNTLEHDECEDKWYSLARNLHGWGRVHLVERLCATQRSDIRAWLLRDGYRNSIMYEYCAYPCATGGGLLDALQASEVDDRLLIGAGEILQALINGGPAKGIGEYNDGAAACERYLDHVTTREATDLNHYLITECLSSFISSADRDWSELETIGWMPEARVRIQAKAERLLVREAWRTLAVAAMATADDKGFSLAARAAETMGLDTWEARWQRQVAGQASEWYFLMQTDRADRVQRVVDLASSTLELAVIASGAADEMGLGPAYRQHSALDFILQDLGRWPGLGWPLVAAGLRSPVVRNRNMALKALSGWGRARWPTEAESALQAALAVEPNARTREQFETLLGTRLPE